MPPGGTLGTLVCLVIFELKGGLREPGGCGALLGGLKFPFFTAEEFLGRMSVLPFLTLSWSQNTFPVLLLARVAIALIQTPL